MIVFLLEQRRVLVVNDLNGRSCRHRSVVVAPPFNAVRMEEANNGTLPGWRFQKESLRDELNPSHSTFLAGLPSRVLFCLLLN